MPYFLVCYRDDVQFRDIEEKTECALCYIPMTWFVQAENELDARKIIAAKERIGIHNFKAVEKKLVVGVHHPAIAEDCAAKFSKVCIAD